MARGVPQIPEHNETKWYLKTASKMLTVLRLWASFKGRIMEKLIGMFQFTCPWTFDLEKWLIWFLYRIHFSSFLFFMCMNFSYMYACIAHACSVRSCRDGCQRAKIRMRWRWTDVWVLRIKPSSSRRPASALNHSTTSLNLWRMRKQYSVEFYC